MIELKAERDTHPVQPIIAVKRCPSSPAPSVKTSTSSPSTTPTTRHMHKAHAEHTAHSTDFDAVEGAQHTCVFIHHPL